jgi:hypothetical protein
MVRVLAHGWALLFAYLWCWHLPTYFLKSFDELCGSVFLARSSDVGSMTITGSAWHSAM